MSAYIKDYFLCSPMKYYNYMKLEFRLIPDEIRQQYRLYDLVKDDGYIYVKIPKGIYGLKQAGRLDFE